MKTIDLGTISMGDSGRDELYQASGTAVRESARRCDDPGAELARSDFYYASCEDAKSCDCGEMAMESQGRILDLTMTLKNVCPAKRVAVGVVLTEMDSSNNEYPRGQKTMTVPAHNRSGCIDVPISSMRFVMPEDISVADSTDMCCSSRHFIARVAAHYIDTTSGDCSCAR